MGYWCRRGELCENANLDRQRASKASQKGMGSSEVEPEVSCLCWCDTTVLPFFT